MSTPFYYCFNRFRKFNVLTTSANRCYGLFSSELCESQSNRSSNQTPITQPSMFERINWERLLHGHSIFVNLEQREEKPPNVGKIRELWSQLQNVPQVNRKELEELLVAEALQFPNDTHPASLICGVEPQVIRTIGTPSELKNPQQLHNLCDTNRNLRTQNLGDLVGPRAYILRGFLAGLMWSLIFRTMDVLEEEGFHFLHVPTELPKRIIEGCGFRVDTKRTMVYEVETKDGEERSFLSGTGEMGIAAVLENRVFKESQLPLKFATVCPCFRAETSNLEEERGIYRVKSFWKVEMFGVTSNSLEESDAFHAYLLSIQERLFSELGLHYKVLEMPPNELGLPAYRKWDIEAWMPGRQRFGEISSCSSCTDFQSRRLNIRYLDSNRKLQFAHTLNGTACAVPRMLISVIETYQDDNGNVSRPECLRKYEFGKWVKGPKTLDPRTSIEFLKTRAQQSKIFLQYDPWKRK